MNLKEFYEKNFALIFTSIYLLANAQMCLNYAPWRDVAQAWLISRDLSYIDMFKQMHYEGHPMLWHVILSIFSKTGFPYEFIYVISLFLMTVSVFLFLKYMPLKKYMKIMLISSTIFIYYLPVITRVYALFPLLIFMLAILWKNRDRYIIYIGLILALMLQTHVYFCGFVGGIVLLLLFDYIKNKNYNTTKLFIALFLVLSSLIVLYIELKPNGLESVGHYNISFSNKLYALYKYVLYNDENMSSIYAKFVNGILDYQMFRGGNYWLGILVFAGLHVMLYKESRQIFILLLCSYGWIMLVSTLFYPVDGIIKMSAISYFLIFVLWISYHTHNATISYKILLNILLLVSIFTWSKSALLLTNSIHPYYSDGKLVASFIKTNTNKNSLYILDNEVFTASVSAYFPYGFFYNPLRKNYNTFATWDNLRDAEYSNNGAFEQLIKDGNLSVENKDIYYLTSKFNEANATKFILKSDFSISNKWNFGYGHDYFKEGYIMYQLKNTKDKN